MTDTKLLPLPEPLAAKLRIMRFKGEITTAAWWEGYFQRYARACVSSATEALREQREFQAALIEELLPYQDEAVASRAEIEALRMEIEGHRIAIQQLYDRAERLAEALRELVDLKDNVKHSFPNDYAARKPLAWDKARAALRDHDKEVDNG